MLSLLGLLAQSAQENLATQDYLQDQENLRVQDYQLDPESLVALDYLQGL